MTSFEDHFSESAREYAKNRPRYPSELYAWLASIAPTHQLAWDCGTGNGQAALGLVQHFERVVATDASQDQISQAAAHERIEYRVERAEDVNLEPHLVDLVTVATAVHWFDLESFYGAVRRAGRPEGVVAVWMYHLPSIGPFIDPVLEHYFSQVLADYWPKRFHYLAERYRSLPFPFEEIDPPEFEMQADWELSQLVGFLESWSGTRRYQKEQGRNPIEIIWPDLSGQWDDPAQRRTVRWSLYLRVGWIG